MQNVEIERVCVCVCTSSNAQVTLCVSVRENSIGQYYLSQSVVRIHTGAFLLLMFQHVQTHIISHGTHTRARSLSIPGQRISSAAEQQCAFFYCRLNTTASVSLLKKPWL